MPSSPVVPAGQHGLAGALQQSEPLIALLQRVAGSRQRLEAVLPLLPEALRQGVRAGPLDETAWVLLVPNAAAAAKLRQMLPTLEARLREGGWPLPPVRIRIQPPST